jgi:hypothetical protein
MVEALRPRNQESAQFTRAYTCDPGVRHRYSKAWRHGYQSDGVPKHQSAVTPIVLARIQAEMSLRDDHGGRHPVGSK